ncbi:MAG: hypothetical protein RBG13Loki_3242 [Promethearchaeota archaeon CR_4]|nr:MAG: hypothetical protein RBG13Loki_3242 [Candidatus Lokiarchaeota archaeon CR_4]
MLLLTHFLVKMHSTHIILMNQLQGANMFVYIVKVRRNFPYRRCYYARSISNNQNFIFHGGAKEGEESQGCTTQGGKSKKDEFFKCYDRHT